MSRFVHVLLASVTALTLSGAIAGPASADGVGSARIVRPDGGALAGGGSATQYGVALPVGSKCAGDTAHRGYRVWSYMVPKGTDPAAVKFTGVLPTPGLGFVAGGEFYGPENTAEGTGDVINVPNNFVFSRLTPQELFPKGEQRDIWESGIACSDVHGNMTKYWNVELEFSSSSNDPGGFTWTVTHPPHRSRAHSRFATGLALFGASVVAGGVLWIRHRQSQVRSQAAIAAPPS